jgi:formylglycine-generating enzyme required for sulfatase activity
MRTFAWGDAFPSRERVANVADESFRAALGRGLETHISRGYDDGEPALAPVGSYPLGVSAVGAHDMIGNAIEWVADGYDPQAHERLVGRDPFEPPTALLGIVRGGSFATRQGWLMAWHRHRELPATSADDIGFRVARSLR